MSMSKCAGCKHLGKYENEIEYGYNSPCTICARRLNDNFEPDDGYILESCKTCAHKNKLIVCMHCSRGNLDQYFDPYKDIYL